MSTTCTCTYTYAVHELPSTLSDVLQLLERYRTLRLSALLAHPSVYLTTDVQESTYTPSTWRSILTDSTEHHLIVVAHSQAASTAATSCMLTTSTWVGMLTLRGPLSAAQFSFPGRRGPPLGPDSQETRWVALGLSTCSASTASAPRTSKLHEGFHAFVRAFTDERLGMEEVGAERCAWMCGTVRPGEEGRKLQMLYEAWGGCKVGGMTRREYLELMGLEVGEEEEMGERDGDGGDIMAYEILVSC